MKPYNICSNIRIIAITSLSILDIAVEGGLCFPLQQIEKENTKLIVHSIFGFQIVIAVHSYTTARKTTETTELTLEMIETVTLTHEYCECAHALIA
jgi:hypothetical protein